MKKIAILTSGGDAPGMNAAIRALVRLGCDKGWKMHGVRQGYAGLLADEFVRLGIRDVGGIIQQGGTLLGTARCPEFKTSEGQAQALRILRKRKIDSLVIIGGNGSQTGAYALSKLGFPVLGIASTIDNDLYGSEISIGVDTALNIALEAIDRLKVTASSHQRAFLVEVMGRESGYLGLMAGIAGGAEAVVIPEIEITPEKVAREVFSAYQRGKSHAVVVVAEGARYNAKKLSHYFQKNQQKLGFELRVTTLGHVQRGGTPTAFDRLLATRFAAAAIESVSQDQHGGLIGLLGGAPGFTPLQEVAGHKKKMDAHLFELAEILAR